MNSLWDEWDECVAASAHLVGEPEEDSVDSLVAACLDCEAILAVTRDEGPRGSWDGPCKVSPFIARERAATLEMLDLAHEAALKGRF